MAKPIRQPRNGAILARAAKAAELKNWAEAKALLERYCDLCSTRGGRNCDHCTLRAAEEALKKIIAQS